MTGSSPSARSRATIGPMHQPTSAPAPANKSYAINGQLCPPEAYYAAACDPARHIAIEACAGAGKTWILVSRILRALFAGAAPQSILAITFTKKAAGEMQQRLSQWLAEFAQASDAQLIKELHNRGIPHPSTEQIQHLRGLQVQLLQNPQAVQIRTFHAWFTTLLQSAPMAVFEALALPYPFSLFESDAALIEQVWPSFYNAVAANAQAEADYAQLIADMGRSNTQNALQTALTKRLEFSLADAAGVPESCLGSLDASFPDLAEYAGDIRRAMQKGSRVHSSLQAALADLPADSSKKTIAKAYAELSTGLEQGDAQLCQQALLTQAGSLRAHLPDSAALRQAADLLGRLQDWQNHAAALAYQGRMTRLLRLLIAQYQDMKRERGWLDMVDVEMAAKSLLTDAALAAWMQERLDAQVRHLLIDEFQDTSPLQWQVLKEWLGNYAGAGGGAAMPSLFLVGDPKQSIYRFRNAEPRVFMDAQALVQNLGGALLSCEHTRRNAPALISTINRVLGAAGMAGFRPHSTESEEIGQVLAQVFERPEKNAKTTAEDGWRDSLLTPREVEETPAQAAECEAVTQWLAEQIQQQGQAPGELMVLARKRTRLSQLYRHLNAHGLPAVMPEKNQLPEQLEVQDIMALIDALLSPGNNAALAQVLKSPIVNWRDADLVALAIAAQTHAGNWWQALQHSTQTPWQNLHTQLLRWQNWLRSQPVYDALFAIYDDGHIAQRYAQAAPPALRTRISANLQGLLAAALDFQSGRFSNSWQFVRALRNPREAGNFPAPVLAQESAIQLLTVHGAKGLEAEQVIIIDSLPAAERSPSYGVLSDWPAHASTPEKLVFFRSGKTHPQAVLQLLDAEAALQARDELNSLYVAMTRAKKRLIFTATPPSKGSNPQAWWHLLHSPNPDQGLPPLHNAAQVEAPRIATPHPPQYCSLLQLPRLPATAPSAQADKNAEPLANSLLARRGQALHRLLEWGINTDDAGHAWQERLMRDYALDAATCHEMLAQAQVLRGGGGAWVWDAARTSWAGNEVEIAHQGQLLRLDRLVQDSHTGCWWVIDYKSHFTPESKPELQAQMQNYIAAVQAAQPDAPAVRGAWIAGDGRWVEYAQG